MQVAWICFDVVSTHAPAGGLERPGLRSSTVPPSACFNTRSSRRAGATRDGRSHPAAPCVSTHAPAGGLERLSRFPPVKICFGVSTHAPAGGLERHNGKYDAGTGELFQHTLQPEGWSDLYITMGIQPKGEFQHTLQPEGWSDRRSAPWRPLPHLFQHTLQPEGWSDSARKLPSAAGCLFQHTLQPEGWSDGDLHASRLALDGFQHTLQPEGWSDFPRLMVRPARKGFNTRSSRRAGATCWIRLKAVE